MTSCTVSPLLAENVGTGCGEAPRVGAEPWFGAAGGRHADAGRRGRGDADEPRLGGDQIMKTYASWTKCHARFIVMSGFFNPEHYKDHPKVIGCLSKPISNDALKKMVGKAEASLKAEAKSEKR